MGEKVTSIFERAIDIFGRKDDMSDNRYLKSFLILENLCLSV